MVNSRILAYQILLHQEKQASHPDRVIRNVLDRHSMMDERDRALMTELVYGVIRWQGRLDWHINALSNTKPDRIAVPVRVLLRLALYQMIFLDRIPNHAAVNETVNIAKTSQPPHIIRFINGVLREAGRRGVDWNRPSAEKDPAEHIAVTTSHPSWSVRKLIDQMGAEETRLFCAANNRVAPAVFRVNTLKTDGSQVIESLREAGVEALPSPWLPHAVRVPVLRQDVARMPAYRDGWIQNQDEASQLVAYVTAPAPGDRVLDLCSGFGVKSAHLAILMENEGEVLAVDVFEWKLEELVQNAARQGVRIIRPLAEDVLHLKPESIGLFDRILLDAPCTGYGAIRRNPDIKWRRHPKDPFRMSRLQKEMLSHAPKLLKTGGVLVYSTCTVFTDENEAVVDYISEIHPEIRIESVADYLPPGCDTMTSGPYLRTWPHKHDMDGFFAARWRKE
jgi:16S rRNA (cytosine967-C5)-methyltransferase